MNLLSEYNSGMNESDMKGGRETLVRPNVLFNENVQPFENPIIENKIQEPKIIDFSKIIQIPGTNHVTVPIGQSGSMTYHYNKIKIDLHKYDKFIPTSNDDGEI